MVVNWGGGQNLVDRPLGNKRRKAVLVPIPTGWTHVAFVGTAGLFVVCF
jgi:hypothetical protein